MDQYHHLVDPDHGIPSIRNTESRDLVVLVVVTTSAPALHTLRVLLRGSVCVVALHCCALLWLVVPCWHPLFANGPTHDPVDLLVGTSTSSVSPYW